MNAPRTSYWKITAGFYTGWIVLFYLTGSKAAKLPAIDISGWIDRQVPFVPSFVWIYFLCYLFPCVAVAVSGNWHAVNITLLSIALVSLAGFAVHLYIPSNFPKPSLGESIPEKVLASIHRRDFPPGAMKFPSLHVAIAWLVWFCVRNRNAEARVRALTLTATVMIVSSTLLTKQHVFADALGGSILACLAWKVLRKYYWKQVSPADDPLAALAKVSRKLAPVYLSCLLCVCGGLARTA